MWRPLRPTIASRSSQRTRPTAKSERRPSTSATSPESPDPTRGSVAVSRSFFPRGIYALIDPADHHDPVGFVETLAGAGIRLLQVRAKRGCPDDVLRAIVGRVRAAGGRTIVNDDVERALLADGVHLGQEDAALHDLVAVRERLGNRIIGLSCGTPAEARAADPRLIDYLGVGPIFATSSKNDAGGPIGVNGVRAVVRATALPCAAIGGITAANIARARESGAAMAAVISALSAAADPGRAARALIEAWR